MAETDPLTIPGLIEIKASRITAPPAWAIMERRLMTAMEEGADWADRRYWHKDGTPYTVFDLDDTYESLSMKPILYAMGGDWFRRAGIRFASPVQYVGWISNGSKMGMG